MGSAARPSSAGRRSSAASRSTRPGASASWRMRIAASRSWSPISPSTTRCSKTGGTEVVTTKQRRSVVTHLTATFPVSARRACRVMGLAGSSWHYQPRRPPRTALCARLVQLAEERPRWGYKRLHVLLRREGHGCNHKLVYRLYREAGLSVRRRARKRVALPRQPLARPTGPNQRWSMDFVTDALADGRKFRSFTIVDD